MIGNHKARIKERERSAQWRRRRKWLIVVVIVLVVAGLAGWYWWQRSQPQNVTANEQIVDQAFQALVDDDNDALQRAAATIKRQRHYEQVPEYVYVVTQAHIEARELDEAKRLLDIFRNTDANHEYAGKMKGMTREQIVVQLENDYGSMKTVVEVGEDVPSAVGGG